MLEHVRLNPTNLWQYFGSIQRLPGTSSVAMAFEITGSKMLKPLAMALIYIPRSPDYRTI